MHSSGSVKARTWYDKSIKVPLYREEYSFTGKKIKKSTVNLFGFSVKLYLRDNVPFEYYNSSGKIHRLKLFGNYYLPFSFSTSVYEECLNNKISIFEKEAFDIGMEKIQAELEKDFSNDTLVISIDGSYVKIDNKNIEVSARYECIEEITKTVELNDIEENVILP